MTRLLQMNMGYWLAVDQRMREHGLVPVIESWWTRDGEAFLSGHKHSRLIWGDSTLRGSCWGSPEKTYWEPIEDTLPFAQWLSGRYKQLLDIDVRTENEEMT